MLSYYFFLIFTGAALLACLAMAGRQPLLLAYIVLGAVLGPFGMGAVTDTALLEQAAHIGIIFLLFLIGLDMRPSALGAVLGPAVRTTIASSLLFAAFGYIYALVWGLSQMDAILVGLALVFSSTIIGIKLLPTTVLHHRHTGEMMVGLLLLQDFVAIFVLLWLTNAGQWNLMLVGKSLLSLPLLAVGCHFAVRYALVPLLARYDRIKEFTFLLAIGWCLGVAQLAEHIGLLGEIGAFIAGITLATSPICQYIALSLKPLRDFFLVVFFFSVGASFDFATLGAQWLPALLLGLFVVGLKPPVFRMLLGGQSKRPALAWDIGLRLGQTSEFSLLVVILATSMGAMSKQASVMVQAATIVSFIISSYLVVLRCPNPIAVSEHLRRD